MRTRKVAGFDRRGAAGRASARPRAVATRGWDARLRWWRPFVAGAVVIAGAVLSAGQEAAPTSRPDQATLLERQRLIRERVRELESRMLKLAQTLGRSEPEKAERLRDALEFAGRKRVRARVERIAGLLADGELGEAERGQEMLLKDLDALLERMTSARSAAARRRAQRLRLEAFKRRVRGLTDEQMRLLTRTRELAGDVPEGAAAPALPALERAQRALAREARKLGDDMKDDGEAADPAAPATQEVGQAAQRMRRAAASLGKRDPARADEPQREALERLQRALDELEQALRQVRREEREETLAALETRIRSMVEREKRVREAVQRLAATDADAWGRLERMRLAQAAETQDAVRADCTETLRILLDEGTTVIVPELLRQTAGDMDEVAARLRRSEASAETRGLLDEVIASLEEILHAVEKKQQQDAAGAQGDRPQNGNQASPLLPGSAELKLLRAAQLRINRRTAELADRPDADLPASAELARRQRRLAMLARKMNERQ